MDKSNLGDHVNLCVGCGLCLRWCLVWNLNPSPYMAPIPCLITHHVPIKMIFSTHCDCKNAPHVLRYPLICTYAEFQDCASIFIAKAGFSTSKWCLEYNEHNIGCAIYRHASYRWKSGCDLPQKKKKNLDVHQKLVLWFHNSQVQIGTTFLIFWLYVVLYWERYYRSLQLFCPVAAFVYLVDMWWYRYNLFMWCKQWRPLKSLCQLVTINTLRA